MKRIFAFVLIMMFSVTALAGCAGNSSENDWEYIKGKGEMVIGITIYKPMNYYDDETNELVGFDTEFAKAVCEKLGVTAKFQVINWDFKETELKSKNIDAIWNGLTVMEERKENMDFSVSYIVNKQVAVIKADKADIYKGSTESMRGASVVAETKSAGEAAVLADPVLKDNKYTAVTYQSDVLLEIKSGTADIGVIDLVMAQASIGEGTEYADLVIAEGIELKQEEYAIGFRLGSKTTLDEVNKAIQELANDGTLAAIAAKYGLSEQIAVKPNN